MDSAQAIALGRLDCALVAHPGPPSNGAWCSNPAPLRPKRPHRTGWPYRDPACLIIVSRSCFPGLRLAVGNCPCIALPAISSNTRSIEACPRGRPGNPERDAARVSATGFSGTGRAGGGGAFALGNRSATAVHSRSVRRRSSVRNAACACRIIPAAWAEHFRNTAVSVPGKCASRRQSSACALAAINCAASIASISFAGRKAASAASAARWRRARHSGVSSGGGGRLARR